jgi:opacity protein-like surface antigen
MRLGVAPGMGRFLVYATGGPAFGDVHSESFRSEFYAPSEANANFGNGDDYNPADDPNVVGDEVVDVLADPACAPGPILANDVTGTPVPANGEFNNESSVTCEYSSSESEGMLGWSLGAGADFLVSDHFSIKAEYLFVNLGDFDFSDADFGYESNVTLHSVRLGGAYRF